MQNQRLPLVADRPKTAAIKTLKVFFESVLFQQVSCGKDGNDSVCKHSKQC
jgi:hypothetical protein